MPIVRHQPLVHDGGRLPRGGRPHPARPRPGCLTEAPWDPVLAQAMTEHRTAVVEELVVDVLLEDLAGNQSPAP
ncbi:DUF2399 domain-containing protein [Streptomyces noursei]|uniref:DUF2399 domain-containing protein n=1 Tax=Streptomyces noursei TaxID=1971 RepID=UPI00382B330A